MITVARHVKIREGLLQNLNDSEITSHNSIVLMTYFSVMGNTVNNPNKINIIFLNLKQYQLTLK